MHEGLRFFQARYRIVGVCYTAEFLVEDLLGLLVETDSQIESHSKVMRVAVNKGLQSLLRLLKLIIHEISLSQVKLCFNVSMAIWEFLKSICVEVNSSFIVFEDNIEMSEINSDRWSLEVCR